MRWNHLDEALLAEVVEQVLEEDPLFASHQQEQLLLQAWGKLLKK